MLIRPVRVTRTVLLGRSLMLKMLDRIPIKPATRQPARPIPSRPELFFTTPKQTPWKRSCLISSASALLPSDRLHLGRSRVCQESFSGTFADDRNDQPSPSHYQCSHIQWEKVQAVPSNGISALADFGEPWYLGCCSNECRSGCLKLICAAFLSSRVSQALRWFTVERCESASRFPLYFHLSGYTCTVICTAANRKPCFLLQKSATALPFARLFESVLLWSRGGVWVDSRSRMRKGYEVLKRRIDSTASKNLLQRHKAITGATCLLLMQIRNGIVRPHHSGLLFQSTLIKKQWEWTQHHYWAFVCAQGCVCVNLSCVSCLSYCVCMDVSWIKALKSECVCLCTCTDVCVVWWQEQNDLHISAGRRVH